MVRGISLGLLPGSIYTLNSPPGGVGYGGDKDYGGITSPPSCGRPLSACGEGLYGVKGRGFLGRSPHFGYPFDSSTRLRTGFAQGMAQGRLPPVRQWADPPIGVTGGSQ